MTFGISRANIALYLLSGLSSGVTGDVDAGYKILWGCRLPCAGLVIGKAIERLVGLIEIKKFESKILSCKSLEFKNLETLSMAMLDYDFDGEVFDLDEVFYAEDLKKHALS